MTHEAPAADLPALPYERAMALPRLPSSSDAGGSGGGLMSVHFDTRPEWLAWLRDWAAGTEEVVALHLFGSRATGVRRLKADALPVPDLDLAYEVAGATEQDRFAASFDVGAGTAAIDFFHRFGVHLDLEFMDGDSTPRVTRFVQAAGVCLWRRDGRVA